MTAHDEARPVVRFSLDQDGLGVYEDPTGDYVLFEDYFKLLVEAEGLRERVDFQAKFHKALAHEFHACGCVMCEGPKVVNARAEAAEARLTIARQHAGNVIDELLALNEMVYGPVLLYAKNKRRYDNNTSEAEALRAALNDQGQGNG